MGKENKPYRKVGVCNSFSTEQAAIAYIVTKNNSEDAQPNESFFTRETKLMPNGKIRHDAVYYKV